MYNEFGQRRLCRSTEQDVEVRETFIIDEVTNDCHSLSMNNVTPNVEPVPMPESDKQTFRTTVENISKLPDELQLKIQEHLTCKDRMKLQVVAKMVNVRIVYEPCSTKKVKWNTFSYSKITKAFTDFHDMAYAEDRKHGFPIDSFVHAKDKYGKEVPNLFYYLKNHSPRSRLKKPRSFLNHLNRLYHDNRDKRCICQSSILENLEYISMKRVKWYYEYCGFARPKDEVAVYMLT